MPLQNYGVVIGTYKRFDREPADNFGHWFHGHIYVDVNGAEYQCAVDVNSPTGNFTYTILPDLDPNLFLNVSALLDGYHELPRNAVTGAIDYIRSPLIARAEGCINAVINFFNAIFRRTDQLWLTDTGENVLNKLTDLVTGSSRIYVFGARYTDGTNGMHDIHYNQGDPLNSGRFHDLDAIWQDGCVIIQKNGSTFLGAYLGRFLTQSLTTDDNGFPI